MRAAGHRVIAPDLVGFGRSDKPAASRRLHLPAARRLDARLIEALDLRDVTLVCQDWGGLIGLRLVAEHADRFARVVAANTFLPTGDTGAAEAFLRWRVLAETPDFPSAGSCSGGCVTELAARGHRRLRRALPRRSYKAGARQFPDARADAAGRSGSASRIGARGRRCEAGRSRS